jgi:hypothetical protein
MPEAAFDVDTPQDLLALRGHSGRPLQTAAAAFTQPVPPLA